MIGDGSLLSLLGDVERKASVATNLKCIVNRLPNDLIVKCKMRIMKS